MRRQRILRAFASSNVLLAIDYDGTLAPIAPTPDQARMRVRTRRLFTQVAHRYPSIAISGRPLDDIARRLVGIPIRSVFGNYGGEPSPQGKPPVRVGAWVTHLRERLSTLSGVVVEDKGYSVTIHYRRARNKDRAIAAIHDAARALPGARVLGGVEAVTLLPREGPDKGVALQRARRLLRCDTAIYVGDDDTDEDAFASAHPDRLLSIRVGPSRKSRARYHLQRQADIDRLLQSLLTLRQGTSSSA
ncbi:MAG: trehalose-phosphatase [Acidobacteria bacterium RIFCSPLOWO2_02_FULL_68_18]|nr:MAG: trehalose-phosphatase [Acidobacteria bacterium RIFCSPLOWO2_02_FULL_68_18]OFW48143.1 MAG: trehalose-phosphatase [Acidobacteria bacterium RIFCSPLOWO2_12_FULL_68_19]